MVKMTTFKTTDEYTRYSLVNYFDVWYDEEGWQINNSCTEFNDLWLANDLTNKQIAEALVSVGFLTTSDMRKLVIEYTGEFIEIYQRKQMMPIASLRPYYQG